MTDQNTGENRKQFLERLMRSLRDDDIGVLDEFNAYQSSSAPFFDKVELAHEFLDLLTFKLKESRSKMDKEALSRFSLDFLRQTIRLYGYNPKFTAVQCKALITYHQNQKNLDRAIEVCEFLILHGITDDDAKGFHVRLDELYRLKRKLEEKGIDPRTITFPSLDDEDDYSEQDE